MTQNEPTTASPAPVCRTCSVEEMAAILGVGRAAAYAAVRSGQVPAVRVGRSWRVPISGLNKLAGPVS